MVDTEKKDIVEDKEDDNESELDLSFKGKAKAAKINILGYETDIFGLGALLLGALATAGTGYLLYDHINKNKAQDEQRRYEQWIAQQQQQQQMVQNSNPPTQVASAVESDMVDMNTVNVAPPVNYDRFLDRGGPLLTAPHAQPNYQVNAQPLKVDTHAEPVVDMNQYNSVSPELEVAAPTLEKKPTRDTTAEELMAAMNNYDYGSG